MIRVVNVQMEKAEGALRAYVARGSSQRKSQYADLFLTALGNPFTLKREAERNHVISQYRTWLEEKLESKDAAVCAAMNRLYLIAKEQALELECFCAPKACHCDVIREKLLQVLA